LALGLTSFSIGDLIMLVPSEPRVRGACWHLGVRSRQKEIAMPNNPTKDEIIALEKEYWDAMKRKDGKRTSQLSGKVALTTSARGVTSIPKAKMGQMTEEGNWTLESYEFDDIEVVTPTPDVAIIAYKVKQDVMMDGKKQELKAADISTWVRGPDGWECHAHSETFLQDGKRA
jgi:hypothetical protein